MIYLYFKSSIIWNYKVIGTYLFENFHRLVLHTLSLVSWFPLLICPIKYILIGQNKAILNLGDRGNNITDSDGSQQEVQNRWSIID